MAGDLALNMASAIASRAFSSGASGNIELTAGAGGKTDLDAVKRYEEMGVRRLMISPAGAEEESVRRGLDDFAEIFDCAPQAKDMAAACAPAVAVGLLAAHELIPDV